MAPEALRDMHTGTCYCFRFSKLVAFPWDNGGGECGVLIWYGDDAEAAQPLAQEAVVKYFGKDAVASRPEVGQWKMCAPPEDPDQFEYRPGDDGASCVLFFADTPKET